MSAGGQEERNAQYGPYTPGFETVPFGDLPALEAALDEQTVAFLV